MTFYMVTRKWHSDIDRRTTYWYNVFVTLDYEKAEEFLETYENDLETDLYICAVPFDTEINFMGWEKYIVETKKFVRN